MDDLSEMELLQAFQQLQQAYEEHQAEVQAMEEMERDMKALIAVKRQELWDWVGKRMEAEAELAETEYRMRDHKQDTCDEKEEEMDLAARFGALVLSQKKWTEAMVFLDEEGKMRMQRDVDDKKAQMQLDLVRLKNVTMLVEQEAEELESKCREVEAHQAALEKERWAKQQDVLGKVNAKSIAKRALDMEACIADVDRSIAMLQEECCSLEGDLEATGPFPTGEYAILRREADKQQTTLKRLEKQVARLKAGQ